VTTELLRRALTVALVLGALAFPAPGAGAAEPASYTGALAVEPGNPDVVWLTSLGDVDAETVTSAIRRSPDGGATVVDVLRGTFDAASPLDVGVSASGIAYAVLERGRIRRSTDGGATWQSLPALPGATDVAVGPPPSETVFAAVSDLGEPPIAATPRRQPREEPCSAALDDAGKTRAGVYRLEGGAWRHVLAGPADIVYPHPTDPSVVMAVGFSCLVYRSTDGGATFALAGGALPSVDGLVFDPTRPGGLLGVDGAGGLVRSDDGGATWERIRSAPQLWWLAQPAADRPSRVIGIVRPAGNDDVPSRRVVVSDDFGRTWRELWRTGLFGVNGIAIAPGASLRVYATTPFAVLRSDDGGTTWSAHGEPLDGHGPAVGLAAGTLPLRPVLGGRRPPTVHVPLVELTAGEGTLGAVVRIAFRYGGKLQTAGVGGALLGPRSGTVPVQLTRAAARAVRAEGSVDALVRIRSIDDAGQERVRWEPVTLIAGGSR
jgi:photosystem II stability/assembly factor-like uncharacterized protein